MMRWWQFVVVVVVLGAARKSLGLQAVLNYRVHDGSMHWELAREMEAGEEREGGIVSPEKVEVVNARGLEKRLDACGFELVTAETQLRTADFYGPGVADVYYAEVAESLKAAFGAAHAFVFSHAVRNVARAGESDAGTVVQAYGLAPHIDAAPHESRAIAEGLLPRAEEDAGRPLSPGRVVYVNAWRSICDEAPVSAFPLAVCDATSVVKPDDYVNFRLETDSYGIDQWHLANVHAARHRWFYFPNMTKSELLVFKQWDSDPSVPARDCFHSAFDDSFLLNGGGGGGGASRATTTPVRQSIETRVLLFFPEEKQQQKHAAFPTSRRRACGADAAS